MERNERGFLYQVILHQLDDFEIEFAIYKYSEYLNKIPYYSIRF